MPIRFACEHCGAHLRVSSRKAGTSAKCPRCAKTLTIPAAPQTPPADAAVPPAEASAAPGTTADPFAQFTVYDDDTELVYETDSDESGRAFAGVAFDPNKVAVSRGVLYLQGVLLGLVAAVSLTLGVLFGRSMSGSGPVVPVGPQPCVVQGVVQFTTPDEELMPDPGAVVLIVPQDVRPEVKIPFDSLRPQAPPPAEDPAFQRVRELGGDYTRADTTGRFKVRVPDRGNYYLLAVSAHQPRPDAAPDKSTLAQIGRFFLLGPDFLGGTQFLWQAETVQRDRELNFVFP